MAMLLLQFPPLPPGSPVIPYEVVQIVQSFFMTVVIIALGVPIIRVISRRFLERAPRPAELSPDIAMRLERIEQAVDSIAIEVERISEGQRYTTKLMSESRGAVGAGERPSAPPTVPRTDR
jgi:hypothetical protein